jgi:hypothetical protein
VKQSGLALSYCTIAMLGGTAWEARFFWPSLLLWIELGDVFNRKDVGE